MSRRKLVAGVGAGLLTALAAIVPAWAYYLITSNTVNLGTSAAATMTAPQSVAVTSISGTATLTWSAPSTPSGAAFTYTVSRTGGTNSMAGSCTNSSAVSGCQDTAATADTSYTWTVTAHLGSWVSPGASVTATAAGTPTQLVFTTQPGGSVGEGVAFTQPTVTVEDSSSVTVTGYTTGITLATDVYTAGNGGTTKGSITGCSANPRTPTNGVAAFTSCTITGTAAAGTYTLEATSGALTMGVSTGIVTITAGSASQIVAISGAGQSAAISTNFGAPLVAEVEDANGNGISGQTVTFSGPAQTGASATYLATGSACGGSTSANSCNATTGSNGQATSSTVKANGTTGTYNLTATSGAFSVNFSETNGAATSLTITESTTHVTGTTYTAGFSGTVSSGDTGTVTVYLCSGTVSSCTAGTAIATVTATPSGTTWSGSSTPNVNHNGNYTAEAYQTDKYGALLTAVDQFQA